MCLLVGLLEETKYLRINQNGINICILVGKGGIVDNGDTEALVHCPIVHMIWRTSLIWQAGPVCIAYRILGDQLLLYSQHGVIETQPEWQLTPIAAKTLFVPRIQIHRAHNAALVYPEGHTDLLTYLEFVCRKTIVSIDEIHYRFVRHRLAQYDFIGE